MKIFPESWTHGTHYGVPEVFQTYAYHKNVLKIFEFSTIIYAFRNDGKFKCENMRKHAKKPFKISPKEATFLQIPFASKQPYTLALTFLALFLLLQLLLLAFMLALLFLLLHLFALVLTPI